MKVVLYRPEIPQNAGNIVRTCAVTGCDLVMIRPLGFDTDDRSLKRAGLDYWEGVNVAIYDNLDAFLQTQKARPRFFSSKATRYYTDCSFESQDLLLFGSETGGFDDVYWDKYEDCFYTIPMVKGARCMNVSNAVAVVIYEAWRQQNFCGRVASVA